MKNTTNLIKEEKFVTIQVLEGSYIVPPGKLKQMFMDLYEECKHGDDEHMNWLKNKIETFIDAKLSA